MNSQFNHYTTEQYLKETHSRLLNASARSRKVRKPEKVGEGSRRNEPVLPATGAPRPNAGTAAFYAVLTAFTALQLALLIAI